MDDFTDPPHDVVAHLVLLRSRRHVREEILDLFMKTEKERKSKLHTTKRHSLTRVLFNVPLHEIGFKIILLCLKFTEDISTRAEPQSELNEKGG